MAWGGTAVQPGIVELAGLVGLRMFLTKPRICFSVCGMSDTRKAFTLIELMVVIGIIAILASMLLPALGGAKERARSMGCLSNLKQLSLGVRMYADDHRGFYPHNFGAADTRKTIRDGTFLNWVNNVMSWELDSDNTNRVWAASGGISGHVASRVEIYRCPSDNVVSSVQRSAGWSKRMRSYSMNAMMGNAGEFSVDGSNSNNPRYHQFAKDSDVPNPSRFFVLIDEHPDSINDGYFLNRFYSGEWFDLPASYHDEAGVIAFADGHVETRKWASASTVQPSKPDGALLPFDVPADESDDFLWLMQRTSYKSGTASKSR